MKQTVRNGLAAWVLVGALALAPLPAAAEGGAYGYNRPDYGRSDDNRGSDGAASTYMETRVSDLETQIRSLNGRLEQSEWQNKQLQTRLDKLQTDVEMRLNLLERGGTVQAAVAPPGSLATPTTMPPQRRVMGAPISPNDDDTINRLAREGVQAAPESDPTEIETPPGKIVNGKLGNLYMSGNRVTGADQLAVKPPLPKPPADAVLDAQGQYDQAFALLRGADYDGAENAFKGFISKNPKNKLVDNAKYWLGETYYARNQFDAAAVAFADAYQSAPKGSKAPDSLLKLGLALSGLKKTEDACTTLGEVTKRYPTASTSVKNRSEQEMKKLRCKS